jgi:two-component system, OmpR family, osmolarity sensor histidine kinase EnvZ
VIKRLLPRSLLGRSLLILVTPLIVVQLISTLIFYERHWDSVTRWLARSLVGEIDTIIVHMRDFPDPANRAWMFETARIRMQLDIEYKPGALLPASPPPSAGNFTERVLIEVLRERLRRRFSVDTTTYYKKVEIRVQLPQGVLRVLAPTKRVSSPTTTIFISWSIGSAILLFIVATIFMRNQVRPIKRLASAAESFGKGRDVPGFKPTGATEVRQASAAFIRMRQRIKRQIAQRTEMLAGVSHDLRTPLTRIKLQLAMLKGGREVRGLRADIAEMEVMLEEYLAFARGEGTETPVETDIAELLREVARNSRRKGKTISVKANDGLKSSGVLTVPVRPNAFRRCVTNLVGNAVQHADKVAIEAGRNGNAIEIIIDDNGPGIPKSKRAEAFKAFSRLDPSRNPDSGGVGLGLTIARDIIRGHGGEVALEDSPKGGLRVRLRLPL